MKSPVCLPGRAHRGLDGDLQAGGDRRRTRSRAGAQRRMAAGSFLASRGMALAPGEESCRTPLRQRRSRRSRPSARSGHERPCGTRSRTAQGRRHGDRLLQFVRGTPARSTAPIQRRPQQADIAVTSLLGFRVLAAYGSGVEDDCPVRLPYARPSAPTAVGSHLASSGGRAPATGSGRRQGTGRPTCAPLHPERGVCARPRVRDQARQGRNGAAVRAKPTSPARRETPDLPSRRSQEPSSEGQANRAESCTGIIGVASCARAAPAMITAPIPAKIGCHSPCAPPMRERPSTTW